MLIGGAGVATIHALHSEPIKREGVIGLLGNELFEHLAAGFLLVGHWSSRIIRVPPAASNFARGERLE